MALHQFTVLQVLPALESGGVERGVLEVAEALVVAGHRSLVISGGGRMVAELTNRGSEHFEKALGTKSPLTLRHVFWLRKLMIEQQVTWSIFISACPAGSHGWHGRVCPPQNAPR